MPINISIAGTDSETTIERQPARIIWVLGRKKVQRFYLMHGGWSNETTTLGTPDQPNSSKNVIDHAIQNGEVEPLIIVCPTYNNESPEDSGDYTLAFYTLTVNYHNELVNDLIPAVEGTYSTYAGSTSPEYE